MRTLLVLPLFLLAAGCATPPAPAPAPEAQAADAQQPKKNCVRETRVGSNIPVTVCGDAQTAQERQRMADEWERTSRSKPTQKQ